MSLGKMREAKRRGGRLEIGIFKERDEWVGWNKHGKYPLSAAHKQPKCYGPNLEYDGNVYLRLHAPQVHMNNDDDKTLPNTIHCMTVCFSATP